MNTTQRTLKGLKPIQHEVALKLFRDLKTAGYTVDKDAEYCKTTLDGEVLLRGIRKERSFWIIRAVDGLLPRGAYLASISDEEVAQ